MDSGELEAKRQALESKMRKEMSKPQVGIRLDILRAIMDDLDANEALKGIFGEPVTDKLGIIAEVNDLKIADGKIVEITKEQEEIFITELQKITTENIKKYTG